MVGTVCLNKTEDSYTLKCSKIDYVSLFSKLNNEKGHVQQEK